MKLVSAVEKLVKRQYAPKLSTIYRDIGAVIKLAEPSTDARAKACGDVVNFISFAAMNYHFVSVLKMPPQLILNIDFTQFNVECTHQPIKVRILCPLPTTKALKVLPKKGDNSNGMGLNIKFYLLINTAGDMMDPLYLIANDNMSVEEFDWYKVKGLGIGTEPGSFAYLYFCKTRSANKNFFNWLHTTVITAAVLRLQGVYGLANDTLAWFQLDGEPCQIACYKQAEMQQHLHKCFIAVGKPPASTTELTQACDNRNCFKGCKAILKESVSYKVNIDSNDWLIKQLNDVFDTHNLKYKTQALEVATANDNDSTHIIGSPTAMAEQHWYKKLPCQKDLIIGMLHAQMR